MSIVFPAPRTLVLIRHAEAENNVLSRKDRTRDEGFSTFNCHLTERGREQAALLGEWLRKEYSFSRYFCSPYVRVLETFHVAYPEVEPNPAIDRNT
ncbi:MAG: phosphoglycerate mutase family protein [Patescibacteria group bacterium]